MTRPDASASRRTARAKRSSSRAAAAAHARPPPAPRPGGRAPGARRPQPARAAAGSDEVPLEQLGPDASRLEQGLDGLAHGAVAAGGPGDVAPRRPSPRPPRWRPRSASPTRRMTWRSARSSPTNAASSQAIAAPRQQLAERLELVGRPGPAAPPRPAARARARVVASECRPLTQTTGMPAARMSTWPSPSWMSNRFSSTALAVDRPDEDAVVGQHAVDVQADQADASGEGRLNHAPGPTSRASGRAASSSRSSGHWVAASLGARAGSGCVSRKNPSAPATAAAASSARDVLAQSAAGAAGALPRLLHRVGGVEDDGRAGRRAEPGEVAHVDHQIAVAEEGAPLGHGDVGRTRRSAPCRRRRPWPRAASTGPS